MSESDEPKAIYIEFEGEGVVTEQTSILMTLILIVIRSGDATLSGGKRLQAEYGMTITKGRGYASSEQNRMPIGVIAMTRSIHR